MTEIISSKEAQNNFGTLLDTAQHTPVVIQRHKRDCAVIMSVREYEEWQNMKNTRMQLAAHALGKEAKAHGLTAKKLEQLLKDES